MAERSFAYGDLTVRVSSEAAELAWLDEFLRPAFDASDAAADCDVVVDFNDDAYAEMLHRGAHPGDVHLDCFILDSTLVRLPRWNGPFGDRVAFDASSNVFYIAAADCRRVRLLTRAGNRAVRVPLMRVVRELAMSAAHLGNRLVLHAAALTIADRGIIVAGPKRAGKTSLLIHLLHHADARYISNDRVVVDLDPPAPTLRGMPTLVTIREPTFALFQQLYQQLLQHGYNHRYALQEVIPDHARTRRLAVDRSLNLTPAQFCTLMAIAPVATGGVRTVLFPAVTDTVAGIALRPLTRDATAERLTGALFGIGSSDHTSEVFALPAHRVHIDAARRAALCEALAAQVLGFECQIGRDAYRRAFPLDDIASVATVPS